MRLPLQITFRHVDPSPSVEDRIREYAGELDRFFDQIMSCRVAVERQHRRHHQGNLFHSKPAYCMKLTIATGAVIASVRVRISAKKKSFHDRMKHRMAVAAGPGAASGSVTRVKAPHTRTVDPGRLFEAVRHRIEKPFIAQMRHHPRGPFGVARDCVASISS
jgi:hypothetical protein